MNTRELVVSSLLLAIGTALHFMMPPQLAIKPDTMLAMMFLAIVLFPNKKNVLVVGIVTGLLTALTTGFPMGQLPNILEKPITAFIFFGLYLLLSKQLSKLMSTTILTGVCTLVSGTLFLTFALFFVPEMPAPFAALFLTGVLPAIILNAIIMFIIYPIVTAILKRSNITKKAA